MTTTLHPDWNESAACYRKSFAVELPPDSMTVIAYETMSTADFQPYLHICGWDGDIFSPDVIVCGKESEKRFVLAGAVTAFRSQSFFTARCRDRRIVEIEVRQPDVKPGEEPEEVVVLEGDDWRELLIQYAGIAADKMGVKPFPEQKNMTGYCSWYYYYKAVTQAHLLENIDALSANRSPYAAEYVQIDDGYQTFQGDWGDRHANWPTPLEVTAKKILDQGMKAGIWLMPFVASTASRTYREHPDWFVKDAGGGTVTRRGWTPEPDHLWACLDTTIEAVRAHLASVFTNFRAIGYTYFKMDGLIYGLYQGVRRDPAATPVSAFRLGLKTIRDAVPDCLLMACSEPFMPCLGLVDHARVSNDTSRYFTSTRPRDNTPYFGCDILAAFHLSLANFWKFDRWFRCDPDVVMTRQDNAFYTRNEAKFSVLGAVMTGIGMTSDNLATLDADRNALLGKAQDLRMRGVRPLNATPGQWPSAFEGTVGGKRAVALVNAAVGPVEYSFADLKLPRKCVDLLDGRTYTHALELGAHDAALLTGE